MADELTESALRYHRIPRPGKIEVVPTKPLATQRDLSLAYSPGVAAACNEIVRDPATAAELTARANLVAVVTNGTAVLGLGAIGPLAAKPVMEGKGVLFKKFAGIDVFDIELAETDQEKLVDIVAALEPTFGGINLEDIKAPGVLLRRAEAARAALDPGVPRRPARHGDHRRRGRAERPGAGRQGHRQGEAGRLGRRRRGAVVPRPAREARPAQGKHLGHRHRGRGLEGPQRADGPVEGALCPRDPGPQPGRGDRAAPTSSSACRRAACSRRRWSPRWRPSR